MNLTSRFNSLYAVILALLFLGCDQIDELTEFEVTEDFSTSFNIDVEEVSEGGPQSIEEFAGIDISDVPEIEDNYNLIESISINSITYEVRNYSGVENATISNASLTFNGEVISIDDVNLEEASDSGNVYEVSNALVFSSIENMLLNSSELSAGISGTISGTPVQFDVILRFNITVKIDVL